MAESNGAKWYVIHTFSGYEQMAKSSLEKLIENNNLSDTIFDIKIPMEQTIEEKNGKKKVVLRKLIPSYVFIKMIYNNDLWHVITNIKGVTGFVGPGSKPVPLTEEEMYNMGLKREQEVVYEFEVGDTVQVVSGVWENTEGIVRVINHEKKSLTISIDMFGRETPVEIGFEDVRVDK